MNTVSKLCGTLLVVASLHAADQPRDLNTLRTFPEISSRAEWEKRATEISEHVQFSCGLWPLPPRTPLNAKVFDRVERDGYTIEKVYFETYPGFFLAGNLYRPLDKSGKRNAKCPAILNPHGHWKNGRMADEKDGSIAARCISFARQGMIAFTYDMVGYNDTIQVDHKFASAPENLLWNISLMGLQTWNSIRALDFLESLPDVDKSRLSCTGESGGGTQTFILGAIDKRLAAQAPIVMVSHSMQGGCLCENAPGLRVDYSNMEIAASVAPRPQVIVSATGDWTKKTMEVEGPAIEGIYKLFRAEDRFDYAIFDYPHNYNKQTREFVYASLGKWLLKEKDPSRLKEQPYKKEPDSDLRVFPDGKLPAGALNEQDLIASMVAIYSKQLDQLKPTDTRSLKKWKEQMMPAWEHALHLQHVERLHSDGEGKITVTRSPDDKKITFDTSDLEAKKDSRFLAIAIGSAKDPALIGSLREKGIGVVRLSEPQLPSGGQFKDYFHTYNRTLAQDLAADIKVVVDHLRARFPRKKIVLVGQGQFGLSALVAAPLADAVIIDAAGIDESSDSALLDPPRFFPGVRRLGSLQGIAALAAPNPLFVHNVKKWNNGWLTSLYSKNKKGEFHSQSERASDREIADWITKVAAN
jgi:hypothetical protein